MSEVSVVGFQIGAALSGGLTPVIASALLLWTGATWPISLYLIGVAVVTLTATFAAPETSRQPLA
jgi:MFS transporter, MHS family, shikimate and dehydroshikimate transport protein